MLGSPPNFRVSTTLQNCARCKHMYVIVAWRQQLECVEHDYDTHPTLVCDDYVDLHEEDELL